jgi:hypothetical protein
MLVVKILWTKSFKNITSFYGLYGNYLGILI